MKGEFVDFRMEVRPLTCSPTFKIIQKQWAFKGDPEMTLRLMKPVVWGQHAAYKMNQTQPFGDDRYTC